MGLTPALEKYVSFSLHLRTWPVLLPAISGTWNPRALISRLSKHRARNLIDGVRPPHSSLRRRSPAETALNRRTGAGENARGGDRDLPRHLELVKPGHPRLLFPSPRGSAITQPHLPIPGSVAEGPSGLEGLGSAEEAACALGCVCVCDSYECACDLWMSVCDSCMSVCDLWMSVGFVGLCVVCVSVCEIHG